MGDVGGEAVDCAGGACGLFVDALEAFETVGAGHG